MKEEQIRNIVENGNWGSTWMIKDTSVNSSNTNTGSTLDDWLPRKQALHEMANV